MTTRLIVTVLLVVTASCATPDSEPTETTFTINERRTGREIAAEACNLAREFPELWDAIEAGVMTMALMNQDDRWTDNQFDRIAQVAGAEIARRCPNLVSR